MPRLSNAPREREHHERADELADEERRRPDAGAPAALLEGQRPSAQVSIDGQHQAVAEPGDHREDDDHAARTDARPMPTRPTPERPNASGTVTAGPASPAGRTGTADRRAERRDRAGRADRGGRLDADVVELEGQLHDQHVEDQTAEQRDADRRGERAPRQRGQLLGARGGLAPAARAARRSARRATPAAG